MCGPQLGWHEWPVGWQSGPSLAQGWFVDLSRLLIHGLTSPFLAHCFVSFPCTISSVALLQLDVSHAGSGLKGQCFQRPGWNCKVSVTRPRKSQNLPSTEFSWSGRSPGPSQLQRDRGLIPTLNSGNSNEFELSLISHKTRWITWHWSLNPPRLPVAFQIKADLDLKHAACSCGPGWSRRGLS